MTTVIEKVGVTIVYGLDMVKIRSLSPPGVHFWHHLCMGVFCGLMWSLIFGHWV